ncbi:MAG: 4-(cytidine 5'-diphospho)-2-C-methyl-D-erythritol kinase [Bdellovibrionales bacterium]|nr:4-(cytidine 5'-diphospho)-2-C-methyl-D-erythritol kinase [Bdellovibrionales bacterium]
MNAQTFASHAKINLSLKITGILPNGYHELSLWNVTIGIADFISLSLKDSAGIELQVCGPAQMQVPEDSSNLAWRAAEAVYRYFRQDPKIAIRVEKHVPNGAGLGGGSSNAASILLHLPRLLGRTLPTGDMLDMAVKLGADVPFFLTGGFCHVGGIGDLVVAHDDSVLGDYSVVLFLGLPPLGTQRVFQKFDEMSGDTLVNGKAIELATTLPHDLMGSIENDLEGAASALEPSIGEALAVLRGRLNFPVCMTGSGSTVFALVRSEEEISKAITVGESLGLRCIEVDIVRERAGG